MTCPATAALPSPSKQAKAAPPPTTPRTASASSSIRITSSPRKTPTLAAKASKSLVTSAKRPSTTSTFTSTNDETAAPLLLPPSTLYRNLTALLSAESCDPQLPLSDTYSTHLARYLRGDISKCEFQSFVLDTLPPQAVAVHNDLILSLLRSVLTVPPPPPPPPAAPTTPPPPTSSPPPAPVQPSDPLSPGALATLDFASHPLPYPRKRRPTHEPADARRTRTRKEAVALPKDDRDRLRRELLAMDPESAGAAAGGEGGGADEGVGGKKKKKSKRAAAAAAAALAATLSGDGMTPNASAAAAAINPFTHPASTSMGPGLDLFGDPPLHGYAYPPTPPPSSLASSSASPDPANTLPLIATSRARHAEYMRLVHSMHICKVQGDLPSVHALHDRMACVMWEQPGGKVEKIGPGAVELMMFGLRTYLKEVVEGMVRVGRVGERDEEVRREVAERVRQRDAEQVQHEEEEEGEQEDGSKMDVDQEDDEDKTDKKRVSAAALALLSSATDGQVQSWSVRSSAPAATTTRQRSTSTSAGSNGNGNGTQVAAPWAGKHIRRPSSFTAPPASATASIAPPLDSPTTSSLSSLVRTHSSRSVASNPTLALPTTTTTPPNNEAAAPPPLASRDRVLTLNHLAAALALEPVLAGDARHVADRVLAKMWHATPDDEQVAMWRGEMRDRVRAREEEAAVVSE